MEEKKKLSEEDEKTLLLLKSDYEMHEKTRKEALLHGKEKGAERIEEAMQILEKSMASIDAEFAKKVVFDVKKQNSDIEVLDTNIPIDDTKSIFDVINSLNNDIAEAEKLNAEEPKDISLFEEEKEEEKPTEDFEKSKEDITKELKSEENIYNNSNPTAQYDVIPLPSNGQCYKEKLERLPVAYLTAYDENYITSPNLYESGLITNVLLKNKILNNNIKIDELVSGDVDAIMLFLRATSYGNDFPIIAEDPQTGEKIETTADLSKIKYKKFTLKGDDNGYFDFELPNTKSKIKFKFLTRKEINLLKKINKKEVEGIAAYDLEDAISKIKKTLESDNKLSRADREVIINASSKIEKWSNSLSATSTKAQFSKTVTNTMELQIVSINGNEDRKFIHESVLNMPASDALAFRRYLYDNEPGVDFSISVERPESKGGGSFTCFLEWNDYVFWHIS